MSQANSTHGVKDSQTGVIRLVVLLTSPDTPPSCADTFNYGAFGVYKYMRTFFQVGLPGQDGVPG